MMSRARPLLPLHPAKRFEAERPRAVVPFALVALLALPGVGNAQGPKPAAEAPTLKASWEEPPPVRGRWELRPNLGGNSSVLGNFTTSGTQLNLGVELAYNLGRNWSFLFGLWGSTDDGFIGTGAHFDWRYRFWEVSPLVKPYLLAGLGHQWGLPRAGKDRRTITAVGVRTGAGLDFVVNSRFIPGIQVVLDTGPRILPSVSSHVNVMTTFGVSIAL